MKWLNWLKKLFWEKEETSLFYMQGHDVLPQPLSSPAVKVRAMAAPRARRIQFFMLFRSPLGGFGRGVGPVPAASRRGDAG